jgi:transglycosylase-like protein with SLT domain
MRLTLTCTSNPVNPGEVRLLRSGRFYRAGNRSLSLVLSRRKPHDIPSTSCPRQSCTRLSQLRRVGLLFLLLAFVAPALRAEYVVLRSGERLHVTSYQLLGDKYRLQMAGGWLDVAASEVVSIEPEEVFTPLPPQPTVEPSYLDLVKEAASRYGIDAELIASVIAVESNFDPKAVSRKNARGLMQLLPETAVRLGVKDVFDPKENIDAGTRYLKELLQLYNNDLVLALAAYNAGPDKVQQYGTVPPYAETISYVRRVKRTYEKNKTNGAAKPATPSGAAAAKPSGSKTTTAPSPRATTANPSGPATVPSAAGRTDARPSGAATPPPSPSAPQVEQE